MNDTAIHIAVIGAGMIGAAAARHLAQMGHRVTLVGPQEPAEYATHDGVFASHYDAGRISRGLDASVFWSRASVESIKRYPELANAIGAPLFHQVGALLTGPAGGDIVRRIYGTVNANALKAAHLNAEDLERHFPDFAFDGRTEGVFEEVNAGYIDPRAMVRAQILLAKASGATVLNEVVLGLDEIADGVRVRTEKGDLKVDRVLVAAGGFSNTLLSDALPLSIFARTVALFRVDEEEARRLQKLPCLIAYDDKGLDPYLLPPIRYPDGQFYLKLGGDPVDVQVSGPEVAQWFCSGGSPDVANFLEDQMRSRMPGLNILDVTAAPCVTTFTPADRPILQKLSDRIAVATAGCGRGAKCSDELGRLGAEVTLDRKLPDWVERHEL